MDSSSKEITFSVIIPVFNGAATIERAIDSVLGQSHPSSEVIVVDDASTDNSVFLVAKYGERVKLIKSDKNAGSGDARNRGMNIASGDYVAFLDADDIWHRDKLALVHRVLQQPGEFWLVFHNYTLSPFDLSEKLTTSRIPFKKLSFLRLLAGNVISTSCAIIKNDIVYRFTAGMRYTEDYDLWLRIAYKHGVYRLDLPLTRIFRPFTSAGGISAAKWKMRKGELNAYTRLIRYNPLFLIMLPFLYANSLLKHLLKMLGLLKL